MKLFKQLVTKFIGNKIVVRVEVSKFNMMLCVETTDISTVEQLTICICFVDFVVRKDFLDFLKMGSKTGIAVKTEIQNILETIGLTFENLHGQG